MDFELTGDQRRWQHLAREYAEEEIRPRAAAIDREQRFPYDIVAGLARTGLLGLTVPEEYGGSGGDFMSYVCALEEIARADTSVAATMQAQISLGCAPFVEYGTEEQKRRYLGDVIAGGRRLWAFGLTEDEAGTDAAAAQTTADLDDGEWVINGSKKWITNSGTDMSAGVTVVARTDPGNGPDGLSALIVPIDVEGYERGPEYDKVGWRGADQHPLRFSDCRVPEENLLGDRGEGFRHFLATLDSGRVSVASSAVGVAQACYEEAVARAKERRQFGARIASFQAIRFKLADMAMEIELARLIVRKAAWLRASGHDFAREASMAKVFASETAKRAADHATQIHGGEGFMETTAATRLWRQVKIYEIGEGTNEINREVIARSIT